MEQQNASASTSGMAVTSLVLGILAVVSSWMPIINNFSFILAFLGIIFAIIGLVGTVRGKKKGKGMAVAGLVLGVLSVIIVLATQSAYVTAIDSAMEGPSVTTTEAASPDNATAEQEDTSSENADTAEPATTDLAVGTTATLSDGVSVTVDAVTPGLANYDGNEITGVQVTYVNNGDKEASFNPFDWEGEDANGAQRSGTYYSEATDELHSGTLAPGGTVTGMVYFDGALSKVVYNASFFSDATVSWLVA